MRFSVIVCTLNRAALLCDALESLCAQKTQRDEFEIVVVDNGSTDDTKEIVERFGGKGTAVRYVYEAEKGLSCARNTGWRQCLGEYVGYVDDECRVPEGWLSRAEELAREKTPDVFGGPFYPFYRTPKPEWFLDRYESVEFGEESRELLAHEYLAGGNIFISRDVLITMGGFDTALGMKGQTMAYGEETDLQARLRKQSGGEALIYYDRRLWLFHTVRPEKMRLGWRLRQAVVEGRERVSMGFSSEDPAESRSRLLWKCVHMSLRMVRVTVRALIDRDRSVYGHWQNVVYELTAGYLRLIAELYSASRAKSHGMSVSER